MKIQSFKNKKGEVVYRQKLYQTFLFGKKSFQSRAFKQTLEGTKNHQKTAHQVFKSLAKKISTSPYLDLGAAACARSMILENEFGTKGVAIDLSFDALKFSPLLAKGLKYQKLPLRIVADIHHLPFKDNCFPFVFTFQTLHHLSNPKPALQEIKRVLTNSGHFYLGEEPVKQVFNLDLWRRGEKRNPLEKILMSIGLLPFLTRIGKEEVKHNIVETSFSLQQWRKFLKIFDRVDPEIKPFKLGSREKTLHPSLKNNILLFLLGGGINALCQVKKNGQDLKVKSLSETLACPDCPQRPGIKKTKNKLFCSKCLASFQIKDGIVFLLPKKLERKLYGKA